MSAKLGVFHSQKRARYSPLGIYQYLGLNVQDKKKITGVNLSYTFATNEIKSSSLDTIEEPIWLYTVYIIWVIT